MRNGLLEIIKIVKTFRDDMHGFWNVLLDMGCVTAYDSEKKRQGLAPAEGRSHGWRPYFRLCGHRFKDFIPAVQAEQIFNDFRALTLRSRDGRKVNCTSAELDEHVDGPLEHGAVTRPQQMRLGPLLAELRLVC